MELRQSMFVREELFAIFDKDSICEDNSEGSREKAESGPPSKRERVKCFSKNEHLVEIR